MSRPSFIYRQGSQRIQRQALLDELRIKIDRKQHGTQYVEQRAENIVRRTEAMACKYGRQQLHEYTVEVASDSDKD